MRTFSPRCKTEYRKPRLKWIWEARGKAVTHYHCSSAADPSKRGRTTFPTGRRVLRKEVPGRKNFSSPSNKHRQRLTQPETLTTLNSPFLPVDFHWKQLFTTSFFFLIMWYSTPLIARLAYGFAISCMSQIAIPLLFVNKALAVLLLRLTSHITYLPRILM